MANSCEGVNNLAVKELVLDMAVAGFSPKTMHNYVQVLKMVVASAVHERGEEIYPRKWNHEFIDLPRSQTNGKTSNGLRDVDVHSSLAAIVKAHIGERASGFLLQSPSGKPLSPSNVRNRSLHPILKAMGETCGFHSFRRLRLTHLRKNRVPEDLIRFWIGHADKSVTNGYSKVKEDVSFRRVCGKRGAWV